MKDDVRERFDAIDYKLSLLTPPLPCDGPEPCDEDCCAECATPEPRQSPSLTTVGIIRAKATDLYIVTPQRPSVDGVSGVPAIVSLELMEDGCVVLDIRSDFNNRRLRLDLGLRRPV